MNVVTLHREGKGRASFPPHLIHSSTYYHSVLLMPMCYTQVTLEHLYTGATLTHTYNRNVICADCSGNGGRGGMSCDNCGGQGFEVSMRARNSCWLLSANLFIYSMPRLHRYGSPCLICRLTYLLFISLYLSTHICIYHSFLYKKRLEGGERRKNHAHKYIYIYIYIFSFMCLEKVYDIYNTGSLQFFCNSPPPLMVIFSLSRSLIFHIFIFYFLYLNEP